MSRSPSPIRTSNVRESRLESTLKATEEERDYYKREFELQVYILALVYNQSKKWAVKASMVCM